MQKPATGTPTPNRTWQKQDSVQPVDIPPSPQGRTDFLQPVPDGGYAWWYVDGISDDGSTCFTVIAFIGSVFSPYYTRARRRSKPTGQKIPADQYVAINAVVYTPGGGKRWAMTERGAASLQRSATRFAVGNSSLAWDNNRLIIRINERCVPFGQQLQGDVVLHPGAAASQGFSLHTNGQHWWQPIAAKSRVDVQFKHPQSTWTGDAYLDHNHGSRMLEEDFNYWSWSRDHQLATAIDYETWQRDGTHRLASLDIDAAGQVLTRATGPRRLLQKSRWGIARSSRMPAAQLTQTLEDTPFYARSVMQKQDQDKPTTVCEHLDLTRFASTWVQCLLPFRMPRNTKPSNPD